METDTINFSAGPSPLDNDIKQQLSKDIIEYKNGNNSGNGLSILEISHRSPEFENIRDSAEQNLRKLLDIPDNYHVLFMAGGATIQFNALAMNFGQISYLVTGHWSRKARTEGENTCIAIGKDNDYGEEDVYLHYCINETAEGILVEYPEDAEIYKGVICDASSYLLSEPMDVSKYAMIYAGAQKNIGIPGVTIVIIRDDLVKLSASQCSFENPPTEHVPLTLSYAKYAENKTINTPSIISIYTIKLITDKLLAIGGLTAIAEVNNAKAKLLYETIDKHESFQNDLTSRNRSKTNVTFVMNSPTDKEGLISEDYFLKAATRAGFIGIQCHPSVGKGFRVSLYNAVPFEHVLKFCKFIDSTQK